MELIKHNNSIELKCEISEFNCIHHAMENIRYIGSLSNDDAMRKLGTIMVLISASEKNLSPILKQMDEFIRDFNSESEEELKKNE